MSRRRRYLVCYDIADPKRLRCTAKVCESFGSRLQCSVFEASLDSTMLARLKMELDAVINHSCDQILFVDMGIDDESTPLNIEYLGLPYLKRIRVTII
ncbi:MAG: CRISPR-associated endonuclease Cas2 [Akkermansia sp.]|nr:CRISPR-associated endonuclease Cas2 [Akkermansia sp.]